ncbi:MAG: EamA family transporter [Candidatus Abawacabacteria bacterium]|nr:EamA family transporter [Candidatus Abawacabacteria bacterium]
MTYLFLALAIVFNATANILMKLGAQRMGGLTLNIEGLKRFLTNPVIWAGIISFGLTLLLYTYVLSKMKLSVAYPLMTSLGFLIVVSFSVFYLHESIHWLQMVGLVLVIGGLYLITQYQ